jgi:two-component system chemotaxis response regulator CheY
VLIVDDSAFSIKQLNQIFSSEGFSVVSIAANGREGAEK